MNKTIVFIDHHENLMDDRAWTYLGDMGFERRLVCPFKGETLNPPGAEICGAVIYGGSQNVGEQEIYPFLRDEIEWIESALERQIPLLGLCLGGQLIAHTLGAEVRRRQPDECEFGYYPLTAVDAGIGWIPDGFHGTQGHYEEFDIPSGAERLARSERFPNQAFRYNGNVVGLQFHPEVSSEIFKRWQQADWAMYDTPGAQTREQQDVLMAAHDELQGRWFRQLLETLFLKNVEA